MSIVDGFDPEVARLRCISAEMTARGSRAMARGDFDSPDVLPQPDEAMYDGPPPMQEDLWLSMVDSCQAGVELLRGWQVPDLTCHGLLASHDEQTGEATMAFAVTGGGNHPEEINENTICETIGDVCARFDEPLEIFDGRREAINVEHRVVD